MFHWVIFILLIVSSLFFLNVIAGRLFSVKHKQNIARRSTQNAVRKINIT